MCEVVKVMSLSGVLVNLALFSRSIVPPVMYLTGTPVWRVNSLPMFSSIRSRKLPPQVLTTSASWAQATLPSSAPASRPATESLRIIEIPLSVLVPPSASDWKPDDGRGAGGGQVAFSFGLARIS
ncbi:hypothetical protein D3C73_1118720 [compost metagenome]